MKTLLTGATSLIGANLTHLLCGQGHSPRLLLREHDERRGLRGLSYDAVLGDLLVPESLARALAGVDEVYHVAGTVRGLPWEKQEEVVRINTRKTGNLLDAARLAGVRRVVVVSGGVAVAEGTPGEPATEVTLPADTEARLALEASGPELEVVVAHPGLVLGPYDLRPSPGGALLRALVRGLGVACPRGGMNGVNAQDVALGLRLLMEKGRPGERYLLGGENLTFLELLTLCAEEAGVAPPRVVLPDGVWRAVGWLGDRLRRLSPELSGPLNAAVPRVLPFTWYLSSEKAMREVGYRPRPVRLGIREALRWFQEEGMIPRDHPLTPRGMVG
ncbi:NAD-dependent epimerase/dehydratase family protein [Melittangium boletus]|uniref:NAD-dependent epimerase/dehydratase domain-containing protein n=1 Tax=Melittangium boletus DSM 14713 TaxID=1294270 RepID=A0A250I8P4_9BACT|nr:NAD-dependent epimerase/dehydratase family protein [Melittangium boletus]ATB27336.1 hypothetical protein MEBOL_000774 [Melittangium boletus DSM 14713]